MKENRSSAELPVLLLIFTLKELVEVLYTPTA
jgi:hypothetical protein